MSEGDTLTVKLVDATGTVRLGGTFQLDRDANANSPVVIGSLQQPLLTLDVIPSMYQWSTTYYWAPFFRVHCGS